MEKYINQGPLTLERQLASYQDISPIYKHLWATWVTAKDDLASILKNITLIFPHYSLHDASHAETIIRRVEAVLGEERIKKLKPTEVWLFLMSAYTHDLGMLVNHKEILKLWKKTEFKDYLISLASKDCDLKEFADLVLKRDNLEEDWPIKVSWAACVLTADYFRKYHAKRSDKIINDSDFARTFFTFDFSFQKFIHERLINLLGRIAMLHGSDFSYIFALPYRCQGMGLSDDLVYPRRLAAMLRLGDLLDMDNGRFDHNVIHINGVVPETTKFHQEKEASLRHFLVTENCIEATFDCPNEGSYEAATSWMNWLKQETEDLALHWGKIVSDNFGTAPVLQSSSIYLNGEKLEGNALKKFDFSDDSIFELMEGANIYKNKFSCLRELVQNAEDASKFQLWEDLQRGEFPGLCSESIENLKPFAITNDIREKYKISITFEYNTRDNTRDNTYNNTYEVQITDHGIGITKERLAQMGKVANSWHNLEQNKERYANMPVWLKPTGAFGIGLQSVFRVTNILECLTVPHNEAAQKIIFRSRKKGGNISAQKLSEKRIRPYGTKFSFRIESKVFSSISYSLGGIFEQKLSDFDPFKHGEVDDKKTLNLYYLLECLCNDVKSSFFPIEVKIKNGQSEKIIPFPVAIDQENKFDSSNGGIEMSFNWETGEVLAYNAKKCITYRLTLAAQLHYGNIAFTFKGMAVNFKAFWNVLKEPYMSSLQGKIHLDGFPTKDWLTLNREEIRSEKIDELQKILEADIITILSCIYHKISKNSAGSNPVEKLPLKSIVALLLLSGIIIEKNSSVDLITMSDIGHIRNILLERLKWSDDVCYLLFEHGRFIEDALGWKKFFRTMWKRKKFFVYDIEGYSLQNSLLPMTTEKLKETISQIISDQIKSNEEKDKDEYDPHGEYFFSWDQIKRCFVTDFIKILKIYGNNNEYIYECQIEESKTKNIPEVSKSIQSCVNKEILVPNRRVTFAMKAYENLAITEIPLLLANARRSEFLGRFSDVFDTFMITPFTNVDKKDIEENDGETCWEHIRGRDDFNLLVQFVREHNVNQSVSGEDIREAYHRWILDIIDARE